MPLLKEYDAKIDTKQRLTLRGEKFDHYHVKEYSDGHIELQPRELVPPFELSKRALSMMDASMENLASGNVSDPIDLAEFSE